MEEIFKQYGQPIIIVSVIVALIAIFTLILSTDGGLILEQFKTLITNFFNEAGFSSAIVSGFIG